MGAGKFTGGGSMICPKSLFERGFEHLVTFRTNVFYMPEVVPADDNPPGNSHQHPDGERPPYAFDDPENDGKPLQRCDRRSGQDHHPPHFFQFFLALHYDSYVTDGFEREFCLASQSIFQLAEFIQFFLFHGNLKRFIDRVW